MAAPTTLRIAWRNLWRSRRRTGLALAAIGLSQALVLVYDGVVRGYGDWMVATITGPMLGDAQAHAPGWREDRAVDRTLEVGPALAALAREPLVASASARVWAPALAAVGEEGKAVVVLGVDPAAESRPFGLLAGGGAERLGGRRVLLGRALARTLGAKVGADLAIVGQAADGSLANDLFAVAGVVDTPVDEVNRRGVIMALPDAQALLAMPGRAHELVIRGRDPARTAELAARAARLPALAGAEVLDWKALSPQLVSMVELVRIAWVFVLVLVFVAAAAGVANTMLMATFERTRELGMLLALGAAPGRIVRLVVVESIALGLVGVALGSAAGAAIVAVASRTGFDLAALAGGGPEQVSFAGMRFSMRLYPTLGAADVLQGVVAVLLTSLLASLWPAARAARLQPATAIRG